jgi:hypothetical protein
MPLAGYSLSGARVNVNVEISGKEGKQGKFGTQVTCCGCGPPINRPHLPAKFSIFKSPPWPFKDISCLTTDQR